MTFAVHGDDIRITDGKNFTTGSDELIVGEGLVGRFPDCKVGEVMQINTVPFRVVGVFAGKGGYRSEIWGDLERLGEALKRPVRSRVIAKVQEGTARLVERTRPSEASGAERSLKDLAG